MAAYGPAEAGIVSCLNTSVATSECNNIGQPVACQLFITDLIDPDRLAPVGVIRELVICGENVADGYLKNPEDTSKAFGVNQPWISDLDETPLRYYRTGDLVKYHPDGSLRYIERKDLQRKIHGQRLELGEIETQIMNCRKFNRAVVELFRPTTLVAFLEVERSHGTYAGPLPPETIESGVLDQFDISLKSALPSYMIPFAYVPIAHFPTNHSGKIDRRLLRSSIEQQLIMSYKFGKSNSKSQPETEEQVLMQQLWAEAIPIASEEIRIHDGFFALGGSSVGVIRLIQSARKRGIQLDVRVVYQLNTLSDMAATLKIYDPPAVLEAIPQPFSLMGKLDKEHCISLASTKCHASRSSVLNAYPCSYMQEAMMIFSEKYPGSYFIQSVFQIPDEADKQKIIESLKAVWLRHDILRTRIVLDEDFRSIQVVLDQPLDVPILHEGFDTYLKRDSPPRYGKALSRCATLASTQENCLVFSQHHVIFDAWSLNLLLHEIKKDYSGRSLKPVETEHFSSLIQHTLQIQDSHMAAQYWRQALSGLSVTRLPQAKKAMSRVNQECKTSIDIPKGQNVSLAILVEAVWGILLGQYTNSDDVCFGVVRSGRNASINNIDTIIGPTITSIPRRLHPAGALLITEYITQVEKSTAEALPWEHYGLQNIRELSESADQACNFQSMVIVQHQAESLMDVDDNNLDLHLLEQRGAWSDSCLTLECRPQSERTISVSLSHDDTVISVDDVQWILRYFCRLISKLTSISDCRVEDFDISGPETITQTLLWNEHPISKSNRRVEELFQERVESWPTLIAIDAVDARLTYRELDDLSSYLASCLKASGLCRGDFVCLCLEKSAVMVIAIIGVLKAGGAYVPLEIDHPFERMHTIVCEVGARLMLCTPRQEASCQRLGPPVATLDITALRLRVVELTLGAMTPEEEQAKLPLTDQDTSSDLAYVIYTSGSTGVPKGVMMEHAALSTTILERVPILGHKPGLRCILYSSYTFDSSVWEVFAPLLHGACVFIPSNEQRLATLPEYLNEKKVEMFVSTPSLVKNILQSPSRCPYLTTLDLGGEAMTKLIINDWSENVRLINDYGPTEACITACTNSEISSNTDPYNIGYAQGDSTHLWVVEPADHSRLTFVGCIGELLISGPTLARGYLNDKEKTSKVFIDCSTFEWAMKGDERCYATGDLVRRNGDGSISFSGRKDTQIQFHGIRIEVEEIENVLGSCYGIKSAVVDKFLQEGSDFEVLVAFLTLKGQSSQNTQEIFLHPGETMRGLINDAASRVVGRLPKYMVPTAYLPLGKIPLLTSGKIDRKALKMIYVSVPRDLLVTCRSHSLTKRVPRTEVQKMLQSLWGQVLGIGIKEIGLDDEFLILGGNSLAAIKLASAARERGFRLHISTIFQSPRLEDMAARILMKLGDGSVAESRDPAPFSLLGGRRLLSTLSNQNDFEDVIPASNVQTSYIIRAQKWYHPYYTWFFIDVDDRISPNCLKAACNAIVQRHQILRSSFHLMGRQCYQVVRKSVEADFSLLKSTGRMDQICCQLVDQDVKVPVQFEQVLTRFRLVV